MLAFVTIYLGLSEPVFESWMANIAFIAGLVAIGTIAAMILLITILFIAKTLRFNLPPFIYVCIIGAIFILVDYGMFLTHKYAQTKFADAVFAKSHDTDDSKSC